MLDIIGRCLASNIGFKNMKPADL